MKKKGLIVLLLIFVLMLILNTFTPLLSDDYFSAFIWPKRVHLTDVSYEAVKRVSSLEDICRGLRGYYFSWGGRVPGGFPVSFFLWQGKEFFNPINAFMIPVLIAEIYWLSHEGKVSIDFNHIEINIKSTCFCNTHLTPCISSRLMCPSGHIYIFCKNWKKCR